MTHKINIKDYGIGFEDGFKKCKEDVKKLIEEYINNVEEVGYENPKDEGYYNALQDLKEQINKLEKEK